MDARLREGLTVAGATAAVLAVAPVTTDADGRYRLTVEVREETDPLISFEPPGKAYATAFSRGGAHVHDATSVPVAEGEESVHDAVLPLAASLSGRFTGEWTQPRREAGTFLEVVRLDDEPHVVREVQTRKQEWTVTGLSPGTYRVRVISSEAGAVYHPSGRVVDWAGQPVADAEVHLVSGWTYALKGGGAWPAIEATARTGWDGRWEADVPTGSYEVYLYKQPQFEPSASVGKFSAVAGRDVTYEVTVDRPALVRGRISLEGVRRASLAYEAHPDDDGGARTGWLTSETRSGESFSILGLKPGIYRLTAHGPQGRPLRLVATGAHSPERFVVRHGTALTDFDLRAERSN